MATKELFELLGAVFMIAGVITLNISAFTMKNSGFWHSVKAFGIDVPNWSFQKSLPEFLRNRDLVDTKIKHRIFFQWKMALMFVVLGMMSFLLSAFSS